MADESNPPSSSHEPAAEEILLAAGPPSWRNVWQLPAAVASVGLLLLGVTLLFTRRPEPDYQASLDAVARLTDERRFDDGLDLLKEIEHHREHLSSEQIARVHQLRADLFYGRQLAAGGDLQANLSQAVEDYLQAEKLGLSLDADRLFRVADALIRLDRIEEVQPLLDRFVAADSAKKHRLMRSIIEQRLGGDDEARLEALHLLTRLLSEPDLDAETRVWTVARLSEIRIDEGFHEEAIDRLLVSMQRLTAEGIDSFPELYLLLGRAYFESGDITHAEEHLRFAQAQFVDGDARKGFALLLLGQIAHQRRQWDESLASFDEVVKTMPGTPAYRAALLGRADARAQNGDLVAAIEDYATLVASMPGEENAAAHRDRLEPTREAVIETLIGWHDRLRGDDQLEMALRFARLGERLYSADAAPPDELLLRLAQSNWELGLETLRIGWESAGVLLNEEGLPRVAAEAQRMDAGTQRQAQGYFLDSGAYYRRRADAFLQVDPEAAAKSLEAAARAFDRGGDYDSAVACLSEFIRLTAGQPAQLAGIYMLGRSYQALQDFDGAIAQFRRLIEEHPKSIEAARAFVPLAECHLRHSTQPNPAEAERLLLHVVEGGAENIWPDAAEYADALIALGTLYSRASDYPMPRPAAEYYPESIRRLTEALDRYPEDPRRTDLHYRLGHAYRLNAEALEREMEVERPDAERQALSRQRDQSLEQAMTNYTAAIEGYQAIPTELRSPETEQNEKFAAFWRADSAFDRRSFHQAIKLYGELADRYAGDPTALVALVQIVNAHAELGEFDAARAAQNRAWRILRELPSDVHEAGTLPLDRDAWERMLRSNRLTGQTAVVEAPTDADSH